MLLHVGTIIRCSGYRLLRRSIIIPATRANTPVIEKLKVSLDVIPIAQIESQESDDSEPKKRINRGNRTYSNSLPPSLQFVRDMMDKYPDYVLLTQMGSFYELYYEHAEKYAPKLNITLTRREYAHGKVPFAGFPIEQLGRHLKVLVKEYGYNVAVVEQFRKGDIADNERYKFNRRVTRVVTPGTFIDEAFENLQENQFLLSLEFPDKCMDKLSDPSIKVGLCWCDISTGELLVQQVQLKDLVSAITKIKPREILLPEGLLQYQVQNGDWYPELVEFKKYFIKYYKTTSRHRTMDTFSHLFAFGTNNASKRDLDIVLHSLSQKETAALRATLTYIEEHLPEMLANLEFPKRKLTTDSMQIDSRTSAALELHTSFRDNLKKGSLLSTLRRTVTPSGTRLLTQWLSAPSMHLDEIKKRQTLVRLFMQNPLVTDNLIAQLKATADMTRILQKFSFKKGEAADLLQMAQSLQQCAAIGDTLDSFTAEAPISKELAALLAKLSSALKFEGGIVQEIMDAINLKNFSELEGPQLISTIDDEQSLSIEDSAETTEFPVYPGMLNPEISPKLEELHSKYDKLLAKQQVLLQEYRDFFVHTYKARTISTRKNKRDAGYALYIAGGGNSLKKILQHVHEGVEVADARFRLIKSSANTCWLSHEPWNDLGKAIHLTTLELLDEERYILDNLKRKIISYSTEVRAISQTVDYLDVLSSFAIVASEKNLVCPDVDNSSTLEIVGGRHLVVEDGLQSRAPRNFTANDCKLQSGDIWIVTGPNMGGKSTFLRQTAIIVILAQIGCYVPCASARIGLVDKIFSRVGSADDLYNDMSTFMVEMLETSFMLKGATRRSLAILDEIGRGTNAKDGTSIAYTTLHYMLTKNRCRALFASHFGLELSELVHQHLPSGLRKKVHFYRTSVSELNGRSFYDHKVTQGICLHSDAIRVAQMAGFPREALDVARKILHASA
ncbi:AaceriABR137Wp [[Ashbya] aceris (nom. inval.)]|nr:AaceriABR137Wp [[Ashbya] aceris (nom. inval.)]